MPKILISMLTLLFMGLSPLLAATYTDAVGRQVSVPDRPQRIISLVPSVTEILFAIDADRQLVAVTDYCTYPDEARLLPSIGSYADPGLENILSHQPDLVIATSAMNSPALIAQLEQLDIPVYVIEAHSVPQTLETIRNLGQLTGQRDQADALARNIDSRIRAIRRQVPPDSRPSILAAIVLQPLTVAGPDTFIDNLIDIAGGRNVVPKGPSRYPTWNFEALLMANPDFILLSPHPGQPDINNFFAPWTQLTAVANGQIVQLNADWLYRPGPRMILGIEALAKTLHPDLTIETTDQNQ